MTTNAAVEFIHAATLTEQRDSVSDQVRTRVLDTLAAITGGYQMPGIDTTRDFAREQHTSKTATILNGSREYGSVPEAALVNGTAANKLDIDDGHRRVKGHPAAVVIPPALAAAEAEHATVGEFLDAVYVGYELAVRAGLAIHETDGVYTGTGSWGAVGAAAAVSKLRGLSAEQTGHALGVAEYHAPRTPIMRGVENPGMTKDGIGWGAYVGVTAVDLARRGFTASGTVFDEETVVQTESLGNVHHVTNGYLKPYPCCRWAHPGIDAVLTLLNDQQVDPDSINTVYIHTFSEASHLDTRQPSTIEEAEYSYPYPVAAAIARGQFTRTELKTSARSDDEILRLADNIQFVVDETIDNQFPSECLSRVILDLGNQVFYSGITRPRGAQTRPLSTSEQWVKIKRLCQPTITAEEISGVQQTLSGRSNGISLALSPWQ